MTSLIYTHILAFLLGSIPFGYLIAKRYGVNVTKTGSNNIGATNVLRSAGKSAGLYTLLADVVKGIAAVSLVNLIPTNIEVLSAESYAASLGLLGMLGHCYSPFMKFKGGKGVATGFGMFLVILPKLTLIAVVIFALALYATRYVSLASLLAAISIPVMYAFFSNDTNGFFLFCSIAAVGFITARHLENIERLAKGEESKTDLANLSKQVHVTNAN